MSKNNRKLRVTLDGQPIEASAGTSLLTAWSESGRPLTGNVGCMGQGVCGACRILLRRGDQVSTALACETLVEEGMQAAFVDHFPPLRRHRYDLRELRDSWAAPQQVSEIFPEAAHCRHCSGCDRACPKGIQVEKMVDLTVEGKVHEASELFEMCIACNLCVAACPENIDPAHLGILARRVSASTALRPADLMSRLLEIERGLQPIEYSEPPARKEA